MHSFSELAYRCTNFSLAKINEGYDLSVKALSETGATPPLKNMQALNLQKMIHAVGLFSVYEAHLQRRLHCRDGFKEAKSFLEQAGEISLKDKFHDYYLAINALKHGDGASYNNLVAKFNNLDFVVDTPTTPVQEEGDVSGVEGLVLVDDDFIQNCLAVITEVSECISKQRPDFLD